MLRHSRVVATAAAVRVVDAQPSLARSKEQRLLPREPIDWLVSSSFSPRLQTPADQGSSRVKSLGWIFSWRAGDVPQRPELEKALFVSSGDR